MSSTRSCSNRAAVVLLAVLALVAATLSALGAGAAGADPAATTLAYGKPRLITAVRPYIWSVSCVSATFCMAGDQDGRLLRFDGHSWTTSVHFADDEGIISAVNCVSSTFCMAAVASSAGSANVTHLLIYNGRSWSNPSPAYRFSPTHNYANFERSQSDCVSSQLCFVVDTGGAIHSWNGHRWVVLKTRLNDYVVATSCASATLCFALSSTGVLYRYDGHSWARSHHSFDKTAQWTSLSCPTATTCVAVSSFGEHAQYRNGTWSKTTRIPSGVHFGGLHAECASASYCGAVDFYGRTANYENGKWTADGNKVRVADPHTGNTGTLAISCWALDSCVAVGAFGSYWVRTSAGWGPRHVVARTADGLAALSCASATACRAFDRRDDYSRYDGTTWSAFERQTDVDPSRIPTGLSCPRVSFCMVVLRSGRFQEFDSHRAVTDQAKITPSTANTAAIRPAAVSCAGPALCLVVSAPAPTLATGSVTTYNGKRWTAGKRPDGRRIDSVSCVNRVRFCAAGTNAGAVLLYSGHTWSTPTELPRASAINSISCSSKTSCMAVSGSRTYAYDGTTWKAFTVPDHPPLRHVSCASSSACAAVGFHTATYFNGTAWSAPLRIDGTGDDNIAIACPAPATCIVATSKGEVISKPRP